MEPTQDNYPIFETNQVLSNSHLNQVFNYLDEQERLTRANLIGIGIVCGLETSLELTGTATTLDLTKGCGVTSKGYLLVEPEDVVLVSYRPYVLPADLDYPPFKDTSAVQFDLWEMLPAQDSDATTTPLGSPANFLNDKAVLLFLELKKEGLRTCSPNDCNDMGSEVTATVRRLLIKQADLDKIIAAANALATDLTSSDLEKALSDRLNLPDLRLPRYDVPNTGPATTHDVFAAFLAVFSKSKLVQNTAAALTAVYKAFKPVVEKTYPSDPFADFLTNFGFLDTAPKTPEQVEFLQYYGNLFDHILKAYDECRWKGVELLCACCPPEGLFPRHLMLGALSSSQTGVYRNYFLPSAAIGGCEERTKDLEQLFQRLVEMTLRFTDAPPLPQPSPGSKTDEQIRMTPSTWGDTPLSQKAIPYYFLQDGTPPLYRLWSPEKSRRNRANQNLGYRSDEYTPPAPAFVTDALDYDLEPYNFLRIEGHLGKNYQSVLTTLLSYRADYRLPIEIVALRTGVFDKNIPVDLSKETCRFRDLEALYDALREELLSTLCEGVRYFYDLPIPELQLEGGTPKLPLLITCAPQYRTKQGTVGAWYEKYLALQARPYIDIDQNNIDNNTLLNIYTLLFLGTSGLPPECFAPVVSTYYLTKLAEILPDSLNALDSAGFENRHRDSMGLIRYFRSNTNQFFPQEDLMDHFDQLLFSCKLEPITATYEEYVRRIREVKQKQLLGIFLQKNPGIQHKAGVPLGGTFILVYHGKPNLKKVISGSDFIDLGEETLAPTTAATEIKGIDLSDFLDHIMAKPQLARDPDIRVLLDTLTARSSDSRIGSGPRLDDPAALVIQETVKGLDDGTVIADFFLPYLCCSDCEPIQYVLPVPPLGLTVQLGCTDPAKGTAEATLNPKGGTGPFLYKLDQQPFQELKGALELTEGPHTLGICDSAGAQSALQSLTVPKALAIGEETYTDYVEAKTYTVGFTISYGTVPYTADSGTVAGNAYTSAPVESEKPIKVEITDSAGCKISKEFQHTVGSACTLPCEGLAVRCGYLFWIPEPQTNPYTSYGVEVPKFQFEFPQGGFVDLASEVADILLTSVDELNTRFSDVVQSQLRKINGLIAEKTGSEDWLRLDYSNEPVGSLGTLWIEHFQCLKFELQIQSFFKRQAGSGSFRMVYTPEGTIIENLEVKIPAFDCIRINKCNPERNEVKHCETVDLRMSIRKRLRDVEGAKRLLLDVAWEGQDQPVAFLWEVQDGLPAFSNKQQDTFTFERMEPTTKNIRLTAYTEKGCSVTEIDRIDLIS